LAQYVPMKSSVTFRLNTGVSPTTGRALMKSVSIGGVDPALTADALEAVGDLVTPLFEHPVTYIQKSQTDQLED